MKSRADSVDTPLLEKRLDPSFERRRPSSRTLSRFIVAAAVTNCVLLLLNQGGFLGPLKRRIWGAKGDESRDAPTVFDWDSIEATESFEFHPCFNGFECAKLQVPLDYFNGTYPDKPVSIAIAKLPAKVPVDDPRYAGPVLINPGGPGGSGVMLALGRALNMQTIVDPGVSPDGLLQSDGKYYDILGFDPRGIGHTEPAAHCLADPASSWSWILRETTEGLLGSSDAALGRLWSMNRAYGTSCKESLSSPDIKQYMTTAFVARDMLQIAEKHAEWAAAKKAQLLSQKYGCRKAGTLLSDYKVGTVKLHYWGFSYGTYLGSTFASMFPDRVGRLILDGVVNTDDYNTSLGQGSLNDTEKAMNSFYTFCLLSGPEACPLATPTSSALDIEQRAKKAITSILHNPISVNTDNGPEIFTYTDVKAIIFSGLYQPAIAFPLIGNILAAVESGGGPILNYLAGAMRPAHVYSCSTNDTALPVWVDGDPTFAVLCGDGVDQTDLTVPEFVEYWDLLESLSPSAGAIWSMLRMKCAHWPIKAAYKFEGEFGGDTSHPILFISNTADPVTPLKSGRIMSSRFPGSVVLVQDSAGHCSLSTPTPCTLLAAREYFQSGKLPDPEIVCIPPPSPWSLNSTDPDSPFYDPSLGQPVQFLVDEEIEEEMAAGKGLQEWAAEAEFFGNSQGRRFGSLMEMAARVKSVDVKHDEI